MSLVRSSVLFQMIFASESLITQVTSEGSLAGVDPLVSGELLVAREGFLTICLVALEWPLARVDPDVASELAGIAEGDPAIRTLVLFGSGFLAAGSGGVLRLAVACFAVGAAAAAGWT